MSFIMQVAQKAKSLGHRNASAHGGRGTGPATGNTQPHISLQTDAKSRSLDSLQTEELSREPAVMLRELQCELQGQGAAGLAGPQHESGTRLLSCGGDSSSFSQRRVPACVCCRKSLPASPSGTRPKALCSDSALTSCHTYNENIHQNGKS